MTHIVKQTIFRTEICSWRIYGVQSTVDSGIDQTTIARLSLRKNTSSEIEGLTDLPAWNEAVLDLLKQRRPWVNNCLGSHGLSHHEMQGGSDKAGS